MQEELSLIVSSSERCAARNTTASGSSFEVHLSEPLAIPKTARNVQVSCEQATVWNVVPNVTEENNQFYVRAPDAATGVTSSYTVAVPPGLHDLRGLEERLHGALDEAGAQSHVFSLVADRARQRVGIRFHHPDACIDFTRPRTCRHLLGFSEGVVAMPKTKSKFGGKGDGFGSVVYGDTTAALNKTNYFQVHSDLVSRGIPLNGKYEQVIAQVLIDVQPGEPSRLPTSPSGGQGAESGGRVARVKFFFLEHGALFLAIAARFVRMLWCGSRFSHWRAQAEYTILSWSEPQSNPAFSRRFGLGR